MLGVSPVAGRLYDGYGPRLPIIIGSFFHVFGLMMTSLSTEYYQFILSQSVCSGIGTSLIITPAMTAVSDVPPLVAATVYQAENSQKDYFAADNLLPRSPSAGWWSRHCRFLFGWCHFPIHGEPPAILNWICLDHACLRISNPWSDAHHIRVDFFKCNTHPQGVQAEELSDPLTGR